MAGKGFKALGVLVAGSLMFSSTSAIAATVQAPAPAQINPWAALSVMSGGAPAAALCGAAIAAAAAGQAAPGCVLPQLDVPPPAAAPPPQPIPVPPVEGPSAGLGISPLILALGALAAGVALYFLLRHHHHHANSPA